MRQIRLLDFVDEDHFDDRVVRDVDLMGAHAVGATVGWPVIAIAKLFGRDVVDLRKRRRRRKCERDFIDERDYVISGRCDQESIIRLRLEDFFWPVEEETERQEYLHVWTLLKNSLVNLTSILQLAHANRVLALTIADRVQRIQYNTLRKTKIVSGRSGGRLVWATSISQYTQLLSTRYTAFSQ